MAPPLVALKDIHLTFGGTPVLTGAELSVAPGDRLCLVGRNGSGKSTLLRIAAGLIEPDRGERFVQPGIRVAYLPQEPDMSGHATTLDYVEAAFPAGEDPYRAKLLLGELGLTGEEATGNLSGGEGRRAALAATLAPEPDILLLDEPTNHLDLPAIEWLEREIAGSRAALVLISHDRRFLEALSRATLWVDRGLTRRLDRGFAAFEGWRDEILEQEELTAHKLDRKIEREQQWMHGGVTARRKRNVRRVAELHTMRTEKRDLRKVDGSVRLEASEAGESGKLVAEAKGVTKGFDGRTIVKAFSTRIARGDRVGIVGPNGAGKTTLLGLLTGRLAPDAGTIRIGAGLETVILDQHREALSPEWTVTEALTGGRGDTVTINGQKRHVSSYMKDFLFKPEQARSPLKVLSGGERARLMLARALTKPSNLLVLDEPTNDLDLETLDLLQELISDYAGTVILVSHDRDFLDRVATGIIAAEGDGRFVEYAGGYTDMIAQRRGLDLASREERVRGERDDRAVGTTAATPPAAKAQRKLSFKEKHALDALPSRMAALEAEIGQLSAKLADQNLFMKNPTAFQAATDRLAVAQAELASAEEDWLELEMKRQELESNG